MKESIVLINIFSLMALLIYPFVAYFNGVSAWPAQGSGVIQSAKDIWYYLDYWYPLITVSGVILSWILRNYNSTFALVAALIGVLPTVYFSLLLLVYLPFVLPMQKFNEASRDFVCDRSTFLSMERGTSVVRLNLHTKKNTIFRPKESTIFFVDVLKGTLSVNDKNETFTGEEIREMLSTCKNAEGKTPLEVFRDGRVQGG